MHFEEEISLRRKYMESNNNILKIKRLLSAGLVTLSLFLGSLFPGNLLPGNLLSGHLLSGYLSGSLQAFAAESSSADSSESDSIALHDAYFYRQEDGQLKYWLDLGGEDIRLHCFFRSGSPDYYEKIYTLFPEPESSQGNTISIREIRVDGSTDISSWFLFMGITFTDDSAVLSVVRDDETLAGGGGSNLLTGSYVMTAGRPDSSPKTSATTPAEGSYDDYMHYNGSAFLVNGGQLRYWIEFRDNFELHCLFFNGDPASGGTYEEVYTLYPDLDNSPAQELIIKSVANGQGTDITDSFRKFRFLFSSNDSVVMEVERDTTKLAGGSGSNLLDGSYTLSPCPALEAVRELLSPAGSSSGKKASSTASESYSPEELCELAQNYYKRHNDFFPPEADYVKNDNGTYTIHLYEIVDDGDGMGHTATSAWYTVDTSGIGTDDIMGGTVNLNK